jgi:hypothetical protein
VAQRCRRPGSGGEGWGWGVAINVIEETGGKERSGENERERAKRERVGERMSGGY